MLLVLLHEFKYSINGQMWNILLSGLVQIGMVELCHFSA
jgi:hypothetical protein